MDTLDFAHSYLRFRVDLAAQPAITLSHKMPTTVNNVRINLVSIEDEKFARDTRTRLDEMLYMGSTIASEIDSRVQEMWKPKRPAGGATPPPGASRPPPAPGA